MAATNSAAARIAGEGGPGSLSRSVAMLTGAALSSVSTDLEEKDAKAATKVQENGATAGDDSIEETVGAMAAQVQNAKDDTVAPALKRKGGPEDDDDNNSTVLF